jgi:hypothetical protein
MISCHCPDTPLPQKEENDSFFDMGERVLQQRGERLLLYWHRRKAGLPHHRKRRMTLLVLSGERLSHHRKRRKTPLVLRGDYPNTERGERLLLYREERLSYFRKREKYSRGPDRGEIFHHHSKRRTTPVVLALEKGWAPPPQKKEKDSSCPERRETTSPISERGRILPWSRNPPSKNEENYSSCTDTEERLVSPATEEEVWLLLYWVERDYPTKERGEWLLLH